ncbi:hypothetical protein JZ751_008382 [Albula glossodonta]|uniref:Uncharacterized protein n=1 Tax=Albula glossodonta TaxID=121402 RepID=A0A8T2N1D8_9TELE|nr:hypothetical protein JZ751_008382 [Albula glossodonta]
MRAEVAEAGPHAKAIDFSVDCTERSTGTSSIITENNRKLSVCPRKIKRIVYRELGGTDGIRIFEGGFTLSLKYDKALLMVSPLCCDGGQSARGGDRSLANESLTVNVVNSLHALGSASSAVCGQDTEHGPDSAPTGSGACWETTHIKAEGLLHFTQGHLVVEQGDVLTLFSRRRGLGTWQNTSDIA